MTGIEILIDADRPPRFPVVLPGGLGVITYLDVMRDVLLQMPAGWLTSRTFPG